MKKKQKTDARLIFKGDLMQQRVRLDSLVLEQRLAESRERARDLILSGAIFVSGKVQKKPGIKLLRSCIVEKRGGVDQFYVSRGAYKLAYALEQFKIDLFGKTCLDIGASTGGFTQVCIENGASQVFSVDVGHNQMHSSLKSHPKVFLIERVNFRNAPKNLIPVLVDFSCVDTSFISLKLILPSLKQFLKDDSNVIALIKPQFEVGKKYIGKKGIVLSSEARHKACKDIESFAQTIGFKPIGLIESPIKGTKGNAEYLINLSKCT